MRTLDARPTLRPSEGALRADFHALPDAVTRVILRGLMLSFGRLIRVEGAERLRGLPEPAIFALNHSSSLESVLAPATLMALRAGRPVHFLTDWMYVHAPVLGWLIRKSQPIPVYRKPARFRVGEAFRLDQLRKETVLDACLARLAAGGSLGIFPEGTRNADPGKLLRGRSGLGEIVLRSGAPVVPVGLHYPAAERLGRPPRIGRLVLRIGEPLGFQAEREAAAGAGERERRTFVRGVVAQVMAALESLSGKSNESNHLKRRAA